MCTLCCSWFFFTCSVGGACCTAFCHGARVSYLSTAIGRTLFSCSDRFQDTPPVCQVCTKVFQYVWILSRCKGGITTIDRIFVSRTLQLTDGGEEPPFFLTTRVSPRNGIAGKDELHGGLVTGNTHHRPQSAALIFPQTATRCWKRTAYSCLRSRHPSSTTPSPRRLITGKGL